MEQSLKQKIEKKHNASSIRVFFKEIKVSKLIMKQMKRTTIEQKSINIVASKLIQFVIKQFRVLGFKPLDKVIDGW
jgi:hypothetical protein